jgi:hypothetical protein
MAGVVSGRLALQGLTVTGVVGNISFDGTATPSDDPAAATVLAAVLMARQSSFDGRMVLSATGQELLWPAAQVEVRRALVWSYSSSLEAFTASVALYGQLTVAVMTNATGVWGLQAGSAQVVCTVGGEVVLSSKAYPGPGFSGDYTWAGALSIYPDPWARLGLQSGAGGMAAPAAVPGGHRRQVLYSAAGWAVREEVGAGRQVLQAYDDTSAWGVAQPVYGAITVLEAGATAPSPAADAQRGDGLAHLDMEGQVVLVGRVPDVLLPTWKRLPSSTVVTRFMPLWAWLALVAAVLLLACCGMCWWMLVLRRRQAQERVKGLRKQQQRHAPPNAKHKSTNRNRPSNRDGVQHSSHQHHRGGTRGVTDSSSGDGSTWVGASTGSSPHRSSGKPAGTGGWWAPQGETATPPATPPGQPHAPHQPNRPQQRPHRVQSPLHHHQAASGPPQAPPRRMHSSSSSSGQPRRQAWAAPP